MTDDGAQTDEGAVQDGEAVDCPCESGRPYADCCQPIHTGERPAATPEELMRARYAAYALGEIDFIVASMEPERRAEADIEGIRDWSEESEWLGLEIRSTTAGGPDDATGEVEFVAVYERDDEEHIHHERAQFVRVEDRWYFAEGEAIRPQPRRRAAPKVGRNEPCPCGSGRKYKQCCGV